MAKRAPDWARGPVTKGWARPGPLNFYLRPARPAQILPGPGPMAYFLGGPGPARPNFTWARPGPKPGLGPFSKYFNVFLIFF